MPELPEVNFARNLLKRNCLGKLIRDVVAVCAGPMVFVYVMACRLKSDPVHVRLQFNDEIVFEGVTAADFAKSLKWKTILEANRHGVNKLS